MFTRGLRTRSGEVLAAGVVAAVAVLGVPTLGLNAAVATPVKTAPLTEASASARAAATGQPVVVDAETTETSLVTANPDGTFTLEESAVPVRVQQADGSWVPVDTTLERRSDGSVGPRATPVGVTLSGGGPGSGLLRLEKDEYALSMSWPGELPEPRLDGSSATYTEVLPGVDLRLTATREGVTQVLIVKSAASARQPALQRIKMPVQTQGLTLEQAAGGGLRAVNRDGNAVFASPSGRMWDSAGDGGTPGGAPGSNPARAAQEVAPDGGPADPAARPSAGDAAAGVALNIDADSVTLLPDPALLNGSETVFPLYIDPPIGLTGSERTVLSSDGDTFWMFNGDYGVGKCGAYLNGDCSPGTADYVNRMYFEFSNSKLLGKHVLDATFRAYETWSMSCEPTWVDLERTNNISSSTNWSTRPTQLDQMGDRYVSAGRGTACSPEQPDRWIEFHDNPSETDENLTPTVRDFANGKFSRLTLNLRAKDEADPNGWKRFDDNAVLQVEYVHKPGVPTSTGVMTTTTSRTCSTTSGTAVVLADPTPELRATVQTAVQPASGEDTGSLQAEWVVEKYTNSAWATAWTGYRPSSGWDPDGTVEKVSTSTLTDNVLYRMKARTQSHWSYDGSSGNLWSSYSSWCYFKVDGNAPKAPTIANSDGLYESCDATSCPAKGGPGVPGSFTFTPNAGDTDITGYRYQLLGGEWKTVSGSTATVSVTPQLSGVYTLTVSAKDVFNRYGYDTTYTFKVAAGQGPVGEWTLDESTGTATAYDTASEGIRHDATLNGGAAFDPRSRSGSGALAMNGSTAYAATSGPVVNTVSSFTVSAWAFLTDTSHNATVLSQEGTHASGFHLYYSSYYDKWIFNRPSADQDSPTYIRSSAEAADPQTNVWTHLAGVYDHDAKTIQLFVNGRPQGAPVSYGTAFHAGGSLQIGRLLNNSAQGEYFPGLVDQVRVWQRALTNEELAAEAETLKPEGTTETSLAARWDAANGSGSAIPDASDFGRPSMQLSPTGSQLDTAEGTLVLDGTGGYASATGPVIDETASFTVATTVQLDSAQLADTSVAHHVQVAGQRNGDESSWAIWYEQPVGSPVGLWKFSRNGSGATQVAVVQATEPAPPDQWVQLAGVYDARTGSLRFYVDGTEQATDGQEVFPHTVQGTGELGIGRGTAGGVTGRYLPGKVSDLRIWVGAMSQDDMLAKVFNQG